MKVIAILSLFFSTTIWANNKFQSAVVKTFSGFCSYNIIEQDHRGIKRITKPMMGFKSFHSAQKTLKGIELGRMIKKGQMKDSSKMTSAEQFYSLAA